MPVWMRTFAVIVVSLVLLTSCATSTPTAVTPAQVAADLTGLVATLQQMEPVVIAADPGALTAAQQAALANDLANAQKALAGLSAGMPAAAGASIAQTIDAYLNDAVNTIAEVVPEDLKLSAWIGPIDAIDAVLPVVETFVNQYLPASATTIAGVPIPTISNGRHQRAARVALTPDQGRAFLGIPVVHP